MENVDVIVERMWPRGSRDAVSQFVGRYTGQPTTTQYSWSIDKHVAHADEIFFTEMLRHNNNIPRICHKKLQGNVERIVGYNSERRGTDSI